ncbi:MAG: hypothetical protein GXY58_10745 [Planctomycetaceae bacterium]|nr:hypothetical protein [Planctomycetaceae bacterium]
MKTKFKTTRCRIGACADPKLAEVPWCSACRRIGIERRKAEQAKRLSASLPHTRLGSELAEATS